MLLEEVREPPIEAGCALGFGLLRQPLPDELGVHRLDPRQLVRGGLLTRVGLVNVQTLDSRLLQQRLQANGEVQLAIQVEPCPLMWGHRLLLLPTQYLRPVPATVFADGF